jgi:hypothetical protein
MTQKDNRGESKEKRKGKKKKKDIEDTSELRG